MADTLYPQTYVALCTVPLLCKMLLKTLSALGRHVPHPPNLVKNYNINAQERMCSLVNRAKLVIFIRGTEAKPECDDSKQLVELLLLTVANGPSLGFLLLVSTCPSWEGKEAPP